MDASVLATVAVALIGLAAGWLANRTTKKVSDSAQALDAWKNLWGPVHEELQRTRAERDETLAELTEERQVSAALAKQNEQLNAENARLRAGGRKRE